MTPRSSFGVLVAAVLVLGAFGTTDAQAQFGPRPSYSFGYYGPGYDYGYNNSFWGPYQLPAYGWYYNPYVAAFPGYSILPPPFATYRMVYGYDLYDTAPFDRNFNNNRRRDVLQLNYVPQMRESLYPAVPFPRDEHLRLVAQDPNVFTFEVTVPTPETILLVGGKETSQKGLVRTFSTPSLAPDRRYKYTVEARWTEGKEQKSETISFTFLVGELGDKKKQIVFPSKTK